MIDSVECFSSNHFAIKCPGGFPADCWSFVKLTIIWWKLAWKLCDLLNIKERFQLNSWIICPNCASLGQKWRKINSKWQPCSPLHTCITSAPPTSTFVLTLVIFLLVCWGVISPTASYFPLEFCVLHCCNTAPFSRNSFYFSSFFISSSISYPSHLFLFSLSLFLFS